MTEYLFIPSACMALYGFYNIYKIKQRLRELELMIPTIHSIKPNFDEIV